MWRRVYRVPFVGLMALATVFILVPLNHSILVGLEHLAGVENQYFVGAMFGLGGLFAVYAGTIRNTEAFGTWMGFIGAHMMFIGWIEFGIKFNAADLAKVPGSDNFIPIPLLFYQGSVGLLLASLTFFVLNKDSKCNLFRWLHRVCRMPLGKPEPGQGRNFCRITAIETVYVQWTFYVISLFMVDTRFLGATHPVTFGLCFFGALWGFYLTLRLTRFTRMMAAVRYAIPVATIWWTLTEIASIWGLFEEIWLKPGEYLLEMGAFALVFAVVGLVAVLSPASAKAPDHLA
jgi:hypothetical protein